MPDDFLVRRKQEQRRKLLRALYGLSDGKAGFTISPMNYIGIGSQVGLSNLSGHLKTGQLDEFGQRLDGIEEKCTEKYRKTCPNEYAERFKQN